MSRLLAATFSFTVLFVPDFTRADESLSFALRVVASSGVAGRFADPVCDATTTLRPAPFARYAADLVTPTPSGDEAFVIDTGGLVQPHGVARHAVSAMPDALAELIEGLGYDALAFGYRDLEGDRSGVIEAARSLASRGLPFVLSNLRCDSTVVELCEVVQDAGDGPLILQRGVERIAFMAFMDPDSLLRVAARNKRGLTIAPLLDSVRDGVRLARARGATVVIVSVDNGESASAIADALALAEALEDDAKPDLLLSARAGENMLFTRPASFRPAVATAPPGGLSAIDIRRNVATNGFDMLVSRPGGEDTASPALDAFIAAVGASYCTEYGNELEGGHTTRPLDQRGLFELATASVREASGAEIAVLNHGAIDESFVPMRAGGLTESDVYTGLRYDEPIVVATVSAEYVKQLARALARHPEVIMLGLTIVNPGAADEAVTINGRPIDARGRYRVATVRFIADGGDGLLPPNPAFEEMPISCRDALSAHLDRARTVDPRDDFVNPADELAYAFAMQTDATFGGTSVHNGPGYEASQLDRENNIVFGVQNTTTLTALSSRFAWENTFNARYRSTRTSDGTREEGDDVISFRSNARYRGLHSRYPKVYVPEPFAEIYTESEFTIPDAAGDPDARTYRHLLIRPTVGAQFTLTPQLGFRMNVGLETEALSPDPTPTFGVGGQLLLTPWTFIATPLRSGTIGGSIDYFASSLGHGNTNRQELRANLDFSVTFRTFFGLAFTSTLFGVRERGQEVAYAFATTASVRVGWYVRTQR